MIRKLMKDSLLPSYRFEVFIDYIRIGFRSISGLKMSAEFEPLAVGGANESPVMLPVPVKDAGRLTLEKGVSPLRALALLVPGAAIADEMMIHILSADGFPGMMYCVSRPALESIEISKLDAEESAMLIETFTVIHHGITPVIRL